MLFFFFFFFGGGGGNAGPRPVERKAKTTHFPLLFSNPFFFSSNQNAKKRDHQRQQQQTSWAKYLKEGTEVQLVTWNGKVISVDPPTTVELEVAATDPGVKGNTVSGGSKPATLETGAVVMVPLFVNAGEKVKVDTRTDQYLSRATTTNF